MTSLDHANHNIKVCNYLGKKEDYGDWVITSAFYAAVHFVRYLMIPCKVEGKRYTDFDELCRSQKGAGEGRHGFQRSYVQLNYPDIDFEYSKLHDMAVISRYRKYDYTREQSNIAKEYMLAIKKYAETKKPSYPSRTEGL